MASLTDGSVFFAYPGKSPLLAETMRSAAESLSQRTGLATTTWEDLNVDGRLIIGEIARAIDSATVVVAEVTHLNSNVLFEVGYSLASNKRLILALDTSDAEADNNWRELGVLKSVGYTAYDGSSQALVGAFEKSRPDLQSEDLWQDLLVQGNAGPRLTSSLFYVPLGYSNDADRLVDRSLRARKDLSVRFADEEEQGLAPLSWYAVQIYQSSAALIHLRGPQRTRAKMHNARASLFAGTATALRIPTLLLAEETFEPPLDYEDLLYNYPTAKQAKRKVETWLDGLPEVGAAKSVRSLAVELPIREFGEYVAENEEDRLPEYFVETGQFRSVLDAQSTVFIGRKGTGKTANMITASATLASDKRNLTVVIKPSGYEFEALLSILAQLPSRDVSNFLVDGIWRYMLLTQIAVAAVSDARRRPAGISTGSPIDKLVDYLNRYPDGEESDFAVRLEHLLDRVSANIPSTSGTIDQTQSWINERIRTAELSELRSIVGEALRDRNRVAVLIDNLDKAWIRHADREHQARVILGLLTAVGKLERELRRDPSWNDGVNVSLAVFLRADIFDRVRDVAREPDKIRTLEIAWDDKSLLARVIEDRYVAQRGGEASPEDLWTTLFAPTVLGTPTRDYLLWRSLPRPRDLVFLCNSCTSNAINRRHQRIEEEDVRSAEQDYSRFAFEALRVEGSITDELDDVLMDFAGANAVLTRTEIEEVIATSGNSGSFDDVTGRLLRANFLGIEVSPSNFEYPRSDQEQRLARTRAQKLRNSGEGLVRFEVHPAFRPYLGLIDNYSS